MSGYPNYSGGMFGGFQMPQGYPSMGSMGGGMPSVNSMQFGGGYPGMGFEQLPSYQQPNGASPSQRPKGPAGVYQGPQFGDYGPLMNQTPEQIAYDAANTPQLGGINSMFGSGFLPQWQGQYQDMMNKYSPQNAFTPGSYTPPSGGINDAFNQAPMSTGYPDIQEPATPAPTPGTPNLGNLGGRLDKGKGITRKAEKKLNKLGYTDNNILNASQAGGGAEGFRNALGNLPPNYKTQTSAGTYTR